MADRTCTPTGAVERLLVPIAAKHNRHGGLLSREMIRLYDNIRIPISREVGEPAEAPEEG